MSNKYKVLLLDGIDPICGEIFRSRGIEVIEKPKPSPEELNELIKDVHGVVVRSATKVNEDLLSKAKSLKVVGRAGVGVDNIDIPACTKHGVLVMNTPDGNTISTAEHACGLILSLVRNIPNAVQSLKEGRWDRKKFMGTEVYGKTLGVIGLGKIGSSVALRMKAFGMNVIGFDPYMTHEKADEMGITLKEVDDVLRESDVISVHTPLTEKTKGLISSKNAHLLKKGVRLVNCARGGIFEEADMLALLNDGTVSELALDVYSVEPPEQNLRELLDHPHVVCTPHLGASTEEAQEKVALQIAEQISDALELKSFTGSLNGKSIALSTNNEVQPYLKLARIFGNLIQQISDSNTSDISINYSGNCAKHAEVLTDAFLTGFLHHIDTSEVNLINARFIADRKGLKIIEGKTSQSKTYSDLITVELSGNKDYKLVSATRFGENSDFRVVRIDNYTIELQLKGDIIIYKNIDKPGMLASVSGKLAENNINIAALSLGRESKDSEAVTAVVVDKVPDSKVLESVSSIEGVQSLKLVSL